MRHVLYDQIEKERSFVGLQMTIGGLLDRTILQKKAGFGLFVARFVDVTIDITKCQV